MTPTSLTLLANLIAYSSPELLGRILLPDQWLPGSMNGTPFHVHSRLPVISDTMYSAPPTERARVLYAPSRSADVYTTSGPPSTAANRLSRSPSAFESVSATVALSTCSP